jgi:hypothetical protein
MLRKSQLKLKKYFYNYTEGAKVDYRLWGFIPGHYDSKTHLAALKTSVITQLDTSRPNWGFVGHNLKSTEYFNLIEDICKSNSIAILHSRHECSFIRELCLLKMKYGKEIPIQTRDIPMPQIKRCR